MLVNHLNSEYSAPEVVQDEQSLDHSRLENSYENWMSSLPDEVKDLRIDQILLPGTHDSAAYQWDYRRSIIDSQLMEILYPLITKSKSFRKFIKGTALAQNKNIYDQLNSGIRFLDLRVSLDPKDQNFYLTIFLLLCL